MGLNREPDLFSPEPRSGPRFGQMPEPNISPVRGSPKKALNRTEPDFGITTVLAAISRNEE